jgi:DNA-binding MarR family transcriptional regulator
MSSTSKKPPVSGAKQRQALMQELQFLGQMSSTETALFHHTAAAKNGLGITDSKTISTLMQEGPMTAGDLATRLSLTTGAVTSVIDRLEKANLAKRVADPHDRRKVIVEVEVTRLHQMGNTYDSIGEAFQKLLQNYSMEELKFLIEYYKVSIELTKQEIAKLSK